MQGRVIMCLEQEYFALRDENLLQSCLSNLQVLNKTQDGQDMSKEGKEPIWEVGQ